MGRNVKVVTIEAAGRDKGKQFLITEKPASEGERWATRALGALARAGVDIPEGIMDAGMAAMFVIGIKTLTSVQYEEARPLLDEMMECVERIPDPKKASVTRPLHETDIEEIGSYLTLRSEVFEVHTGFSLAGTLSYLGSLARRAASSNGNDTQT